MQLVDFVGVDGKIVGVAACMQESLEEYLRVLPDLDIIRKVVLFGSALKERCTLESDLDFVVSFSGTRRMYYAALRELRERVPYVMLDDFIGYKEEDYATNNPHGVLEVAKREGVVVYDSEQGVGRFVNKGEKVFERIPRSFS